MNSERLYGIDGKFQNGWKELNYIEIQWNRKMTACGDFTIYMPLSEYDSTIKYVKLSSRPEHGIIQKVQYTHNEQGKFVTLSGFFSQIIMNMRCNMVDRVGTNFIYDFVRQASTPSYGSQNWYTCFTYQENFSVIADSAVTIEKGVGLCDAMYQVIANRLTSRPYIYGTAGWDSTAELPKIFINGKVYRDLSSSVVFSEENANIAKLEYVKDESAAKMFLFAYDTWEDGEAVWYDSTAQVIANGDETKTIVYYASSDTSRRPSQLGTTIRPYTLIETKTDIDKTTDNREDIKADMIGKARAEVDNYVIQETVTFDALQNGIFYLSDYDIGDKVTVEVPSENGVLSFGMVISEIREVHRSNQCEISLVMGEPIKQQWRRI